MINSLTYFVIIPVSCFNFILNIFDFSFCTLRSALKIECIIDN